MIVTFPVAVDTDKCFENNWLSQKSVNSTSQKNLKIHKFLLTREISQRENYSTLK